MAVLEYCKAILFNYIQQIYQLDQLHIYTINKENPTWQSFTYDDTSEFWTAVLYHTSYEQPYKQPDRRTYLSITDAIADV